MHQAPPPQPQRVDGTNGRGDVLCPETGWALFLDVDGTLVHLADRPDSVEVSDHLRSVLVALRPRLNGAIALISGRRLKDLDRLFAPLVLPAAGLHGLEHRNAEGTVDVLGRPDILDPLREPLSGFARKHAGVQLEDKGRALALHFRRAPKLATAARHLVSQLLTRHGEGLRVIDGKMVLEIKPALADKGRAVRSFLAEAPFRGRRPVFIGDDTTDEDAFLAVNELGGYSIRVGDFPETQARFRLADVDAVIAWLEYLPAAVDGLGSGDNSR